MKHKLAIILSGICLGLIGPIVKLIGDTIPLMSLNFFRMFFGFLFVLAFISITVKNPFKVKKKVLKEHIVTGFLMAAAFSLFAWANLEAPVSNVVLINSFYVIFVAILGFLFLKEKIQKAHLIAIPIALFGMWILNPFQATAFFGSAIALIQALVFSFLVIFMRHEEKYHDVGIKSVMWFFLFASIFLSPFLLMGIGDIMPVLPHLIALGVICTGIAYILFMYGLDKVNAETSAILTLVSFPISSIIFAYLLLGEVITLTTAIGGLLLIFAGIFVVSKGFKNSFISL